MEALPEECIATIVTFTTPRDACVMACISSIIKSAVDYDFVWAHFLPSNYHQIISRSDESKDFSRLSKKLIFMRLALSPPLFLDRGALSFSLEKSTCKKCVAIAARNLSITWGDTPRYWAWRSEPESRFSEVAELLNVCWLEIKGKVETSLLSPNTKYAAYLVFKLTREAWGFHCPLEVTVVTSGGNAEKGNVYLEPQNRSNVIFRRRRARTPFSPVILPILNPQLTDIVEDDDAVRPKERSDKWLEVELGEFLVPTDEDGEVEFSVMEVRSGSWKSGLILEGIEIRPILV